MKNWSRSGTALIFGSLCWFEGVALAQTDVSTKAAAEGLFDQGREAMRKGDFVSACGLLERSQQIDPAVGTLLYLGECYEKNGRTASAWATFRDAASSARAVGQLDRAELANERAERLTPVLSKLTLEVSETVRAIPGLVLRRQGQVVPPAAWNVAVPLDPGRYRIEASAPGYRDWSDTVEVSDGASRTRAAIPPLQPAPGSEPGAAEAGHSTGSSAPGASNALAARARQRDAAPAPILAYVLGGAGVVGIGLGSYFGLRAISKNSEAEEQCATATLCQQSGLDLTDEANSAASISNIAFGLGFAALAGGVVLYLTAPDPGAESPQIAASLSPGWVSVGGSF